MKFGPAVKIWRENQRLSQESVAKDAELTVAELDMIENSDDEKLPEKKVVHAICSALGIPPTYMVMLSIDENDIPEQRGKTIFGQLQGPIKDMLLEMSRPNGLELVARERKEHFKKHKRTVDQDIANNPNGELLMAAKGLMDDDNRGYFPHSWDPEQIQKMMAKDKIGRLIVAGSLVIAEIDRLLELERREKEGPQEAEA